MGVVRTSSRFRAKRFSPVRKVSGSKRRQGRATTAMDSSYRSVVPRMRNPDYGFPDKMVTNLRYVDTVSLTGAVGVAGANTFRFNGLNDPDLSGAGHQPMYFDQICGAVGTGPYSRYRVLFAKVTVRYAISSPPSLAAANFGPVIVGLQTSATSGLYGTTASALCEASGSRWTYLGDKGGGNNTKTLTATFIPSRDLGVDIGDDTLSATYASNPSNSFHCIPWKVDTVGGAAVTALIQIEYKVEFFDRNEVAQS